MVVGSTVHFMIMSFAVYWKHPIDVLVVLVCGLRGELML